MFDREVDRDAASVTLAVSESDLTRMRHLKPADVVIDRVAPGH